MLFVGIDLAETQPHHVCLMREDTVVDERRVPNTAAGLRRLLQALTMEEAAVDAVLIAVERPDTPFVDGLVGAGYTVYAINPKGIERYRDRVALGGTKTDRLDARCLAGVLRTDRAAYRPLVPESARTRELRLVTRDLAELEKTQTMLAHQWRAALLASFPAAVAAFRDLTAPSTLGFLRAFPTRDAAPIASDDERAAVLKRHGYSSPGRQRPALRQALAAEPRPVDAAVCIGSRLLALVRLGCPVTASARATDPQRICSPSSNGSKPLRGGNHRPTDAKPPGQLSASPTGPAAVMSLITTGAKKREAIHRRPGQTVAHHHLGRDLAHPPPADPGG